MTTTELTQVKEESRELDHMTSSRLTDSLFSKDLAPHYMKLAGQLAASELVPKCFRGKPADLFLCWAMGYQIGIPPEQSMNCIMVVNGKAVMWGDEMLALCMAHKEFLDIIEEPMLAGDKSVIGYRCTVKRMGRADKVSEFDLNMAKKAGLLAKGGIWNQYPERMLKLRARGFCLRDAFPDALKGIKSREEVEDYIEAEYTVTEHKGSRTEQLKKDYLNKTGKVNEHMETDVVAAEDSADSEEAELNQPPPEVEQAGEETPEIRAEIGRLILEKGFTEVRLAKALKYYEVDSIEEMTPDALQHFYEKLIKL